MKSSETIRSSRKESGLYLFKSVNSKGEIEAPLVSAPLNCMKLVEKLPSTGPLVISDLQDFLKKSKTDFQILYNDKSISDLKASDFKIIRKLGSGGFGKVVLAELIRDKEIYAIKVIDKEAVLKSKTFRYVHSEKRILQSVNFPFIIYLKYFFVDFTYLYFVMPFVSGGDFFDYLDECKPLKENDARFYITQLVLALEYLHYLELIHRDVKPENIMMDTFGYIKLADFGQCIRVYGNDRAWTMTGTLEYMAPEIFEGKGYDCSVDWWALGVILYELCAGQCPFKHRKTEKLHKLITNFNYELPPTFSPSLRNLIKMMMMNPSDDRIANHTKGAKELKNHVWFKGVDWKGILNRTLEAPYVPNETAKQKKNNI